MSDEKNPENTEEIKKEVEQKNENTTSNEKVEGNSSEANAVKKEENKVETKPEVKLEEKKPEEPKKEEKSEEPKKEETKKEEEYKTVDGPKKSDTKPPKPKKPLGKRILHFIIGFIIYLVIVAVISAIYFLWEKSNEVTEEPAQEGESQEVSWGDTYIKILEDEDNFKNLEDVEIALSDLGQDGTPELIVYGVKEDGENSANIYNINKNGEVDTVKFELSEEFNTEYLYNPENDEYEWYIVTDSEELYEINLDEDDYNVESSDEVYDDYEVVGTTEKTPYEVGTDDANEIFDDAEKAYNSSEDLKNEYNDSDKKDTKPSSSNLDAEAALEAYKEALIANNFGEELEMYDNVTDASNGYATFEGDYIFLTDLDGDEIPELFYTGEFMSESIGGGYPYGQGTIQMMYENGELEISFNGEVYLLGIFKNLQGEGYFAQISASPQWDSGGYHIIDLTNHTEFIVERGLSEGEYYRFDYTDVGNLQNWYEQQNGTEDSDKYQTINETQYNDYCAQYVGEDSYPAGSYSVTNGMGEIVTTEFDASSLDESQIDEKFDEAIENYNDLCDTLSK